MHCASFSLWFIGFRHLIYYLLRKDDAFVHLILLSGSHIQSSGVLSFWMIMLFFPSLCLICVHFSFHFVSFTFTWEFHGMGFCMVLYLRSGNSPASFDNTEYILHFGP